MDAISTRLNMTFAHYDFTRGSSIHEHFHAEEEVYKVIEGELEVTTPSFGQGPHRRAGHNHRLSSKARFRLGAMPNVVFCR